MKTLLKKFYSNDENFIKSWEKTQKNGILIFILKTCIFTTVILGILGYIQSGTLTIALSLGIILGILISLMQWFLSNDRYNNLKEKEKMKSNKYK